MNAMSPSMRGYFVEAAAGADVPGSGSGGVLEVSLGHENAKMTKKWEGAAAEVVQNHLRHVNPQFPQVLKIIGFNRNYVRAEGCYLYDQQGSDYLDFLGGYSVFNLGHNPSALRSSLKEVLDHTWPNLIQMDLAPLSGLLAKELTSRDPSGRLQYAYFGNSGAEAVETALKFAKATTKRSKLISFESGFHGLTMGALSVCGDESWQEGFGPFLPDCVVLPWGDLARLEKELSRRDVAAIIAEPIQGEGGVRELPSEIWREIQRLCRKYGTLLILDEIQTGMGRTGRFYAYEHYGLEPDLVCLSKALTNGMVPCSVTLGTKSVFDGVFSRLDRCVVHSSTFGENNLAMAAALTVVEQISSLGLVEKAAKNGAYLKGRLEAAIGGMEFVKEIRGKGMMVAIEFGSPRSMSLKMGWTLLQKANKGLFGQMVTSPLMTQHRILTQVAGHNLNVLKLSPPLIAEEKEVDRFVSAMTKVLEDCHRFPGGIWDFGLGLAKRALPGGSNQ